MSATNRSDVRNPDDFYETPAWCVDRLLDKLYLPGLAQEPGRKVAYWLEPCAGDGAIVRAVDAYRARRVAMVKPHYEPITPIEWALAEKRKECREPLERLCSHLTIGDFLLDPVACADHRTDHRWDVAFTNPPYGLAREFVEALLPIADYVVLLLRTNFLESEERASLFHAEMPDVYILPNRPSFTGGGTDATSYCWMMWGKTRGRKNGRVSVLATTSKKERLEAAKVTKAKLLLSRPAEADGGSAAV